jgi:hypothetical protein
MARQSKIVQHGLTDLLVTLYFDKGKNQEECARVLTERLTEQGIKDSVTQTTVSRWLKEEKARREAAVREVYVKHAEETLPSDLEAINELKDWYLETFRSEDSAYKRRREAASDLMRLIDTRLRIALACDPGDKTAVRQLNIIQNEVRGPSDGLTVEGVSSNGLPDFRLFRENPAAFGEVVLGETFAPDVRNLMESVRDNQITVARSANATGKTHAAARIAAWWFLTREQCQIYTAAAPPESNLKKLLWGEIGGLADRRPDLFEGFTVQTLHIAKDRQNFLTGVTIPTSGTESQREAKFSGKHSPNLLFILDEGDAIPDEVYRGIESCMSGGHARLLVMFNPRAGMGPVYRMERDNEAAVVELSAFRHPNVTTGRDEIPGAVTRAKTIERIHKWCRPLLEDEEIDSECWELPKFLVGETCKTTAGDEYPPLKAGWYKVMEPAFSYMVLGQYPAVGSSQLISVDWVSAARNRWDLYVAQNGEKPPEMARGVLGLDVAEYGVDANAAAERWGGWVPKIRTWNGIDTVTTADRAVEICKAKGIDRAMVDGTGVGAGVAPNMERAGITAHRVMVASSPTCDTEMGEFYRLRDQLWWAIREWLRLDAGAMLPPDDLLIEELSVPDYVIDKGKIRVMDKEVMREKLKRSPDRAEGLMLTFYDPELVFC